MKTTNKIRYVRGILGVIAAATILSCMFLSCEQPDGPDVASVGKGSVLLTASIGSSSSGSSAGSVQRTIIPATPTFSSYKLVFTKGTGEDATIIEVDNATNDVLTGEGYVQALDAGEWTVKVSAYQQLELSDGTVSEEKAAENKTLKTFTIIEGKNEAVEVYIEPIPWPTTQGSTVPTGFFTYTVSFPEGATGTLTLTPGTGTGTQQYQLTSETSGTAISVKKDVGSYKLLITLEKEGGLSAKASDQVHIYSGLESKAVFEFGADAFTPTVYLAGSLALPSGLGGSLVTLTDGKIKGYTNSAYDSGLVFEEDIEVSGNGNEWIVGVPYGNIPSTGTLYFDLEATGKVASGSAKTYTGRGSPTGNAQITSKGLSNILLTDSLKPADVDTLTASVANGKVILNWTDPADIDLDSIVIAYGSASTTETDNVTPVTAENKKNSKTISGLSNGVSYTFNLTAVDTAGNTSGTKSVTKTPNITWTAKQSGGAMGSADSKEIVFTFDGKVETLDAGSISMAPSDKVTVGTGTLSTVGETESTYTLSLDAVNSGGEVAVTITGGGIEPDSKNVMVYKDTKDPAPVTGLSASTVNDTVVLNWTDPTDSDLKEIEITWTASGTTTQPVSINKGVKTYTATGLIGDTSYTFNVTAVDTNGRRSTVEKISAVALTTISVKTVEDLNSAITNIKKWNNGKGVVQLSSDFYTSVNAGTTSLVIDAGAADNSEPYKIKGLGKSSSQALSSGIILANDNVTLEDVKIILTDPTKAATTNGTPETRYTAAVSIGRRGDSAWLTGDDLASKNVTVQNCDIYYAKSTMKVDNTTYSFNAGIFLIGSLSHAAPQNIRIINSTVTSAGTSTTASQAVVIEHYDPSIVITGNTLSSSTGGAATVNGPASALFLNINPNKIADTATPQISGNTLDGKNIDFYVNIYSTGDYIGVPALFASKFGTYYSTWVTDTTVNTDSFYRKLYNTLIGQAKPTGYAGLFFMVLGGDQGSYDGYCFVYEAWEKNNGAVTALDYWGATILQSGGAAQYNAGSDANTKYDTDAATGSEAGYQNRTKAGYRGRIALSGTTKSYSAFKFHPDDTTTQQGSYLYTVGIPATQQ
jgi:hypothetical protein